MQTEWFTLQDARLQLEAVQRADARGRGRRVDLADRRRSPPASTAPGCCRSPRHRKWASTPSARTGRPGTRSPRNTATPSTGTQWRLVGPMHLADTKEQARKDIEYGIVPFSHYFTHVLPAGPVRGDTPQEIIANVDEDGFAVIGTPDDAIAQDPGARRRVGRLRHVPACSATTGPTPKRPSAASNCSPSTSCRTSTASSRRRRHPANG